MTRRWLFFVALLLVLAASNPIRGCVESQFTLAPDSRIPKWFSLPPGYARGDVTVKLTYYTPFAPVDDTVIQLMDKNGRTLAEVTGQSCWHPTMEKKRNKFGGFDPDTYPHYVYIQARGEIEVLEHRQAPIFRITDDPILMKEALASKRCDKG